MAEKKTPKVRLRNPVSDKIESYSVDQHLPEDFYQQKLKQAEKYIPVYVYREIIRQLNNVWIPYFEEPKYLHAWTVKEDAKIYLYCQKCKIQVDDKEIEWVGYHNFSLSALLSSSAHGNFKTLEAKAVRDTLKDVYRIFDYGVYQDEEEKATEPEPDKKNTKEKSSKEDSTKQSSSTKQKSPGEVNPEEVLNDIKKQDNEQQSQEITSEEVSKMAENSFEEFIKTNPKPTKSQLKSVATEVKETAGVKDETEQKRAISNVLKKYLDKFGFQS